MANKRTGDVHTAKSRTALGAFGHTYAFGHQLSANDVLGGKSGPPTRWSNVHTVQLRLGVSSATSTMELPDALSLTSHLTSLRNGIAILRACVVVRQREYSRTDANRSPLPRCVCPWCTICFVHACLTALSVNRRAVATRRWAYQSSVGAKEASQVLTVSGTLIHPSASTTRTRPTSSNTRGRSNIDLLLCTYRWEPLASTPTTKACNRQLHVLNTQNLRIEERADTASYSPRGCMGCARNTPTYGLSQFVLRSGSAAGIDSLPRYMYKVWAFVVS